MRTAANTAPAAPAATAARYLPGCCAPWVVASSAPAIHRPLHPKHLPHTVANNKQMNAPIISLHPVFDGCVRKESHVIVGRLVYSTEAMEEVLRNRGWNPEDARTYVAELSLVTHVAGWPDFLD